MNLLPYRKIEIQSDVSPEEFLALLAKKSGGRHSLFGSPEPLVGNVEGATFKTERAIIYRNSFLPIAVGQVLPSESGSIILFHLRPPIITILFMTFWFGVLFSIFASLVVKGSSEMMPQVVFMLSFGYLLVQSCFWFEVPKIEKILRSIASNG